MNLDMDESCGECVNSAQELKRLREKVCAADLCNLRANLETQLAKDAGIVWRLAALRRRMLDVIQHSQPSQRNKDRGPLYEFNNIYARFYIAARNQLSQTSSVDHGNLSDAYAKMISELAEKNLEGPRLEHRVNSLEDLPESPELEEILSEMVQQEDNDKFTFSFADAVMVLPKSREKSLRQLASSFVEPAGVRASNLVEQILKVTVLNYILASSGLYWGFGPDVYKQAISIGAVLECFASPFNHSLPVFCSPCAPLDLVYGSLGSFYSSRIDAFLSELSPGALIVANPPYLESELAACFRRVDGLVSSNGLRAISIYPKWDGDVGVEQFRERAQGSSGFVVTLEPKSHAYFDYQESKFILATFASLGFALCAASVGEKEVVALRDIFKAVRYGNKSRHNKRQNERTSACQPNLTSTIVGNCAAPVPLATESTTVSSKRKETKMPILEEDCALPDVVDCSSVEPSLKRLRVHYANLEQVRREMIVVPSKCTHVEDLARHLQERVQSVATLQAPVSLAVEGFVLHPKQRLHGVIRDDETLTITKARSVVGS